MVNSKNTTNIPAQAVRQPSLLVGSWSTLGARMRDLGGSGGKNWLHILEPTPSKMEIENENESVCNQSVSLKNNFDFRWQKS